MSYLCRPQNTNGCRCVRKLVKIEGLRIKLLIVSNVLWYCEIAQVQYYSFFLYTRMPPITALYNISVRVVALPNNLLHHEICLSQFVSL